MGASSVWAVLFLYLNVSDIQPEIYIVVTCKGRFPLFPLKRNR